MQFAKELKEQNKKYGIMNAEKKFGEGDKLENKVLKENSAEINDFIRASANPYQAIPQVRISRAKKREGEPVATLLSKRNLGNLPVRKTSDLFSINEDFQEGSRNAAQSRESSLPNFGGAY